MEDFFSAYQKDTTASRIVPLAMKKLELDMETEKFAMAKQKAMQDISRENLLRTKMNQLFQTEEQEVTLPAVEAPTVNTMFGGKATLGEGLPAATMKTSVARKPSIDEITGVLMQHGKDPEKVLKDIITANKPNIRTLTPGAIAIDAEGKKIAEGNPVVPKAPVVKSVDLGDKVDIYENGKLTKTEKKGLSPSGEKTATDKDETKKEKKEKEKRSLIDNAVKKLEAWEKKYYQEENPFNNEQKLKLESLIAQLRNGEVSPDAIKYPSVITEGNLVHGGKKTLKPITPEIVKQIKAKTKTKEQAEEMAMSLGYDPNVMAR